MKDKFADFFAGVSATPNENVFQVETVFAEHPDATAAHARLVALVTWIQQLPLLSLPLVPCDSQALDASAIATLEERAQTIAIQTERQQHQQQSSKGDTTVSGLRIHDVISPLLHPLDYRSATARKLQIGSRILYLCASGVVPFGTRGTVRKILHKKIQGLCFERNGIKCINMIIEV